MEVAILNYDAGKVILKTIPEDIEDIDTYLEEEYGYDVDTIEWMCNKEHIEILDER